MKITKQDLLTRTREEILAKAGKNKTEVFKTYEDFQSRPDKKVNGVSPEFAENHPDWQEMNATDEACWNCNSCIYCIYCNYCNSCDYSILGVKLTAEEYKTVKRKMRVSDERFI